MGYFCRLLLLFTVSFLHSSPLAMSRDQVVLHEAIISPETEGFDCHSSCLIEVSPGTLCAVWKGGPGHGLSNKDMKHNVGIWSSHFKEGQWSPANQIVETPDSVCWNPVLTKYPSGELVLFYRVGFDPRHTISLLKRSIDGGISWSDAEILPAGIVGPTKSKPVFDREGNMLCGSSVEAGSPEDKLKATACWIEILSKEDHRWSKSGPIVIPGKPFGCIEPCLYWGDDGLLKLLCRDRSNRIGLEGWIWSAESCDNGKTWSELKQTSLPNPDAGIEVLSIDNGKILVIYNDSHLCRYPLTIALSEDGGNTWTPLVNLEDDSGEFPSAVLDSQGFVHVIYAWTPPGKTQRRIKHVVLVPNCENVRE